MKQKFNGNSVEFKKDDEKAYNEVQYLILVNGQYVGKPISFNPLIMINSELIARWELSCGQSK